MTDGATTNGMTVEQAAGGRATSAPIIGFRQFVGISAKGHAFLDDASDTLPGARIGLAIEVGRSLW